MGKMRAELLWKSFVSRHQGPVWLWAKIFLVVRGKSLMSAKGILSAPTTTPIHPINRQSAAMS